MEGAADQWGGLGRAQSCGGLGLLHGFFTGGLVFLTGCAVTGCAVPADALSLAAATELIASAAKVAVAAQNIASRFIFTSPYVPGRKSASLTEFSSLISIERNAQISGGLA
jgi:hypothetical protein